MWASISRRPHWPGKNLVADAAQQLRLRRTNNMPEVQVAAQETSMTPLI